MLCFSSMSPLSRPWGVVGLFHIPKPDQQASKSIFAAAMSMDWQPQSCSSSFMSVSSALLANMLDGALLSTGDPYANSNAYDESTP
jgi:hypothetical protein